MVDAPKDPLTDPSVWNSVAVAYDAAFSARTPELLDEALRDLSLREADEVLDLATGPGTLALAIAPRVKRIVAIDFAEQMITILKERLRARSIANVEPHVMDGQALTLPDASFDVAASMFGWFLFADRMRGLAELRRVLRPGGRLLVTSWMPSDRNAALGVMLDALRAAIPDMPKSAGPLPTQIPDVVAEELRAAGFENVTTRVVAVRAPFASVDEYWNVIIPASAPVVMLRKRLGDERWNAVAERARAHLREKLGDGAISIAIEAIYARATR
jgi:ubiquinone/menaquinone biosynthesis C-methylase UbiE